MIADFVSRGLDLLNEPGMRSGAIPDQKERRVRAVAFENRQYLRRILRIRAIIERQRDKWFVC